MSKIQEHITTKYSITKTSKNTVSTELMLEDRLHELLAALVQLSHQTAHQLFDDLFSCVSKHFLVSLIVLVPVLPELVEFILAVIN